MEQIERKIKLGKKDTLRVCGLGDLHFGSANLDKESLKEIVGLIKKTKNMYWVGMGDMIEAITPTDKRWDTGALDPDMPLEGSIDWQISEVVKYLKPIRKKCLGFLAGNHERKLERVGKGSRLVHRTLCNALNVPTLGYSGYITLHIKTSKVVKTLKIFAHHGWSGARTDGGKIAMLQRLMDAHDVDIVMIGHSHTQNTATQYTTGPNSDGIAVNKTIGIITGSFMETYALGTSNYSEEKGYRYTSVGIPVIKYNPSTDDFKVEI
jgi:predicted phosphodiesterase